MGLRSSDEGDGLNASDFVDGMRREKELREALLQASLDLMNLAAYLRIEGHAKLAGIGDEMYKTALAAARKK